MDQASRQYADIGRSNQDVPSPVTWQHVSCTVQCHDGAARRFKKHGLKISHLGLHLADK